MLRDTVRAPAGYWLVAADYGGQEVRILAGLADDAQLIADLQSGDLYQTAAAHAGVDRRVAKQAVLSILYGASVTTLARHLDRPTEVARRVADAVVDRYPTSWTFLEHPPQRIRLPRPLARLTGYDEVLEVRSGGRRRLGAAPASRAGAAQLARGFRNFRVQGPAATMGKLALLLASRRLAAMGEGTVVHFVTDELVAVASAASAQAVAAVLSDSMTEAHRRVVGGQVPPDIKVGVGESWATPKS